MIYSRIVDTDPSIAQLQDDNQSIRWRGVFVSPEWEARFRADGQPGDIYRARLLMVLFAVGTLAYIPNDYHFFGQMPWMIWMLIFRLSVVCATVFALTLLHRGMAAAVFDRIVLAWSLAAGASMLVVAYTRPANFLGPTIVNVLSVLITYWALPVPLLWRAVSGCFLSAGVLVLCFVVNAPEDAATQLTTALSVLTVNLLGIIIAREGQISRRRQFWALARQRELSASLQRALGEIKTLRGILPICMHCKKIWNDAGFWEQLETYVSEHTHAEFTHGLCPECMRSQYPEIDWEKKQLVNPSAVAKGAPDDRPA